MIKQLQLNRNHIKIERALISVFDKTGVVELAKTLEEMNVEILSTGGTYKVLQEASIKVVDVSEYTKFPEIMNGRVKTINPLIGGGLLGLQTSMKMMLKKITYNGLIWLYVTFIPLRKQLQKKIVMKRSRLKILILEVQQ